MPWRACRRACNILQQARIGPKGRSFPFVRLAINAHPPILWGVGLLDRLYASYRRNTLETTISRSIWIDSGGTIESTARFRSKIQVRDPNWRSVSTIPIGIWILDPRSELIQGKKWQAGTEVSKCVETIFCASKNRKTENAQNEILDVPKFGQKVLKTTPGPSQSDSP